MIRGTTPTHTFHLPIDTSTIKEIRITYRQNSRIILEKTEADVEMDGSAVQFTLTQEETLKFSHKSRVQLQVKVLTNGNVVLASPIKDLNVSEILNDEVLE